MRERGGRQSRKLLVASIGVASMTYVATTGSVASCGGRKASGTPDSGRASDAADVADSFPVGNLACVLDTSIPCSSGGSGFSCTPSADDPEVIDPTMACTTPTLDPTYGQNVYCCLPAPSSIGASTCVPDDKLPSVCPPGSGLYGYQCASGYGPTKLDPTLACSAPVPDADGVHTDTCCAPGPCMEDPTVPCAGSAMGLACSAGSDPESTDPTMACTTVTPNGATDDFCCFSTAVTPTPATCSPNDRLTAVCPGADAYPFQCSSGSVPTSLDPGLTCAAPTTDPDGIHQDYCCTLK